MGMQTIEFKDGTKVRVDVPADATKEEIVALANQKLGRFSASEVDLDRETREQRQARLSEELGAIDYGIPTPETGVIGDLRKGFGAGFVGTGETAALGAATLLDEGAELAARERIQGIAAALKPKGGDQDDLSYKIGQTFGSIAGFVAPIAGIAAGIAAAPVTLSAAATTGIATGAGALLGIGTAAGEASERARAAGATQEERNRAIRQAAPFGVLEVLPLGRFMRAVDVPAINKLIDQLGPETVETIGQRITNASVTGGAEAAQEVTAEIVQNLAERGYNPDRAIFEGTGESAALGGGAGATIQFLVDAFTNSRKAPTPTTEEAPLGITDQREGIAGLLPPPTKQIEYAAPERAKAQARADIGRILDAEGDVALGEMQDIVTRTGITLPDLEKVVAEETQKRGSKLAQRAREEIEDELTTPEEPTPESRRQTAVADALAGRSAVQAAARRREEQAALERDDIAAFVQPDLLAAELEQDRQRAQPAKITPKTITGEAPIQGPRERDLVDMMDEESALAREIEAEETATERLRREAAEETAQGKLATDRATQTEAIRTKILQNTVANAGEVRRPEALRRLYEKALADAGLTNTKATKQEMESLRRASNVIRAKDPVAEAAARQEAIKDPEQIELEELVGLDRKRKRKRKIDPPKNELENVTGESTLATSPNNAGLRKGDASGRKGVGTGQEDLQATARTDAPDGRRLAGDRTDAAGVDAAKKGKPSALDKTTAIRVQQWWRDTQEGGGLRTLSDLTESREEKLAQQYANRASAAYDQKYGIRPDEIGLPHRRTPSARWGGQDFVEAKKEAEALGDSEMLTAINEIERTNIELKATKDIDSRAREDSARELKELFPEYAEQVDADLQGFVKRALDQKIDRIEPKFKPKSKPKTFQGPDRPTGQVIPGTRVKVDRKTLKRTGKKTFVDDPSLAPPRDTTQRKDTETNFGQALRKRWKKLNKFSSEAIQRESRAGAVNVENRLSNKLNKAIFDKLEGTQKNEEIRRYLERYPNVEAAIEDAYIDSLFPPKTGEANVAPSAAKKVIEFVNDNKDASDAKILDELQRNAAIAKENIESKRTIDDTLFGEKNANDYARNLVGRIGSLERAMSEGDIDGALDVLTQAKDPFIRNMATKFKTFLRGYGVTLKIKKNLTNDIGEAVQGLYDAKTKTIFIDSVKGMDAHTLLHETAHALTVKIATEPMSKLKDAEKTAKKKLKEAYDEAKRLLQNPEDGFATEYGLSDMAEFAAEILSNQKFKNILVRRLEGKEETLYDKFKNAVRALVGKPREITGDDKLNGLIEAILRPDPDYRGDGQYALGNIKDVKEAARRLGATQRKLTKDFDKQKFIDNSRNFIRDAASKPRKLFFKLMANQALGDIVQRYGFGNLGYDLDRAILEQRGAISIATQATKEKVEEVQAIFKRMGDDKVVALNQLIYHADFGATIYQVDPFIPAAEAKKRYEDKFDPSGNPLFDIWKQQQDHIKKNRLRGDGKKAYDLMREHYRKQYERARQTVLNEIDALGKESGDPELAGRVKKSIYDKLFEAGTLEVYFPLVREGNYKLTYRAKDPRSKREEFIVELFDTRDERDRAFEEVEADPLYADAKRTDGELSAKDYETKTNPNFAYDIVRALEKAGVESKAIEEVMRVFIATLPETSFAKQLQPRQGRPGFKEDSMYALRTKGYDIAVQAAKLAAAANIRAVEKKIRETEKPKDVPPIAFEDSKAELLGRGQFARQGSQRSFEEVGRRLNQIAFVYTIGFNASSALVNLSQIPLFVAPYLSGKYGVSETKTALTAAAAITTNINGGFKEFTKRTIAQRGIKNFNSLRDFYDIDQDGNIKVKDDPDIPDAFRRELTELAPLVKVAAERGQLVSQSYLAESMGLDEAARAKRGGVGNIADYVSGLSAYLFNHAEKLNRQTTMIAAYKLHLNKLTGGKQPTPEQVQEAVEEAIYMTQEANGGAYLETGPSLAREGVGRVALMYKSYGLQMYYSMFKQAKRFIDAAYAKDKDKAKEAFGILLGIHGSALFFAGLQGIPIYGAVRLISNLFFLDDEEEDFDTLVRRNVGEGWYKGPLVALTGLDTASRTALTGLLIQENKYNPDPSLEETIGFYIGGPALSTANRIKRGIEDLGNGFTERGIENLMPTAVANAYKGLYRYQRDEGALTRRGDPIYDDFNWLELLALTGGIQAAGYTQASDVSRQLKKIDKTVNRKRSELSRKYYVALRQGDIAETRNVFSKMMDFNRRHPEAAVTPAFLKRSLSKHMETSQDMLNGVLLSPTYKDTLMAIRAGYQDLSE